MAQATRTATATTNGHAEAVPAPPVINRRIVPTLDFAAAKEALPAAALPETLHLSVTHFYAGLADLSTHLAIINAALPAQLLPPHLVGTIQEPGRAAAPRVQVEVELPAAGLLGTSLPPRAITADDAAFAIAIPA